MKSYALYLILESQSRVGFTLTWSNAYYEIYNVPAKNQKKLFIKYQKRFFSLPSSFRDFLFFFTQFSLSILYISKLLVKLLKQVYPMYKAFIEPDLQTAHIKIINKFNPFTGFQSPTYILKVMHSPLLLNAYYIVVLYYIIFR